MLLDYVLIVLRVNSVVYGFVDMGYGIGGLVVGLIIGYLINYFKNKNIIVFFFILVIIGFLILYWIYVIFLIYVCMFSFGLSNLVFWVVINIVLMYWVDKKFMGRVIFIWNGIV